jgi:hypothetical protein
MAFAVPDESELTAIDEAGQLAAGVLVGWRPSAATTCATSPPPRPEFASRLLTVPPSARLLPLIPCPQWPLPLASGGQFSMSPDTRAMAVRRSGGRSLASTGRTAQLRCASRGLGTSTCRRMLVLAPAGGAVASVRPKSKHREAIWRWRSALKIAAKSAAYIESMTNV